MKALIAVDGSEPSQAIARAIRGFSGFERLILLHVYHVPQLAYPGTGMTIGQEFSKRAEEALRCEGNRLLEEFATNVPPEAGPVEKRIESGPPAETILAIAEDERVDVVMVGSRGLGRVREQALGSVSHRVVGHSSRSTLVVKSETDGFTHVLLPVEKREDADRAYRFLATTPFRHSLTITLMHVIPFMQPDLPVTALVPDSLRRELFAGAEQFVLEEAERFKALGHAVTPMVLAGAPSITIREQAEKLEADLIMVGVQREGPLSRFLLGSVSHSVVHHAPCSVLVLKEH